MKRIIALLLALMLVFALCACGAKDVSGTVTPDETENVKGNVESEGSGEPEMGNTVGGTYKSEFLGIGLTLDSNWTYATKDELLAQIDLTADAFDDEDIQGQIKNANMFYDMLAASNDGYANMNIVVQNVGVLYGKVLDEDTYIKMNVEQMPGQLAAAGMEVQSCEAGTIEFAGETRNTIVLHSISSGVDVYQICIIMKIDSYFANITVTSYVEDITADLAAMFYAI